MLGFEITGDRGVRNRVWVKSGSLVLDHHRNPIPKFTLATNLDEFAGIETIAVKDRIAESLPNGEPYGGFLAGNAMRLFNHASQSVYQR
jgi:hypothetical protein